MKKILTSLFVAASAAVSPQAQEKPDTLWFQFDDRFTANEIIDLTNVDSIRFENTKLRTYKHSDRTSTVLKKTYNYRTDGLYRFDEVDRYLMQPSEYYGNDFTDTDSRFCFERSVESEHFVIYWENGLTKQRNGDITGGASTIVCNVNTLLDNVEVIWDTYVNKLGFLEPGNSTTDKMKISMFIIDQAVWRADGSGQDGRYWEASPTSDTKEIRYCKGGLFHCNTWAASSNTTVAHEIGHTFQYLVSADLGMTHGLNYVLGENSKGNEWWEDCANWQAHQVYPDAQWENWKKNQAIHHLNILHEDGRYENCYYHDWWCQLHGKKTIGRIWREAINPECPIQAYMRIFGHNEKTFADEQFTGYAHIAAMDIGTWHNGQHLIGSEHQRLVRPSTATLNKYLDGDTSWWIVNPDFCPQNYGYNANPVTVPAAGTVVKAQFKGLAGCDGYRAIKTECAGWRYGFVAYSSDTKRTYGEMGSDAEGEVSITIPEKCTHLWLVVMGAPTKYWIHSWDGNIANDEQWPYAVKFTGASPK